MTNSENAFAPLSAVGCKIPTSIDPEYLESHVDPEGGDRPQAKATGTNTMHFSSYLKPQASSL